MNLKDLARSIIRVPQSAAKKYQSATTASGDNSLLDLAKQAVFVQPEETQASVDMGRALMRGEKPDKKQQSLAMGAIMPIVGMTAPLQQSNKTISRLSPKFKVKRIEGALSKGSPDQQMNALNALDQLAAEELGLRTLNAIKRMYPVGQARTNQILTEIKGLF